MTAIVLVIFGVVYLGMALGRLPGLLVDRTGVAVLGAISLVIVGATDGPAALRAIDFPTLIVLFGLMVLSAQYAACGFYTWCAARLAATAETRELDRGGIAKALVATLALLALFATPLPHTEGVLVVAGALLVSRRLATRRLFAYVDWHLLVLFAGLFVVTASLTATGLPAALLDRLAGQGWRLASLEMLAPLVVIAANTIGNVPLVVLLLGVVANPSPEFLYALALVSTLAGNLLLTGSLANIIAVERAAEVGFEIGFLEHARVGVPVTVLSLALALLWLAWRLGV